MIYIVLNGRLGNNLFQLAAGISLAKKYNSDYVAVCQDGYLLSEPDNCYVSQYIEQFKDNIFRKIKFEANNPHINYYHYHEPTYTYQEIPYHENIRIRGWFQSEKYFDKELVRDLFEIPPHIKEYILNKYQLLFQEPINSINVRRGDYLKLPHQFPICSINYYKKGINEIGKKERYLIISDDIEWCKKNFVGDNFFFIEDEEPIIDLYLQTLCENNIIGNSTFSWWAAWLNPNKNKKVICPTPWFGKGYKNNNDKDLIPESWIRIKNTPHIKHRLKALYLYTREESERLLRENTPSFIKEKLKRFIK